MYSSLARNSYCTACKMLYSTSTAPKQEMHMRLTQSCLWVTFSWAYWCSMCDRKTLFHLRRLLWLAVLAYRYCFCQTYLAISTELEKKKENHRSCFTAECCDDPRNVAWEVSTIRCKIWSEQKIRFLVFGRHIGNILFIFLWFKPRECLPQKEWVRW